MSRPNAAQVRLLSFLALVPGASFTDLARLEQVPQVRAGDDLYVPSLVAQGWAEMGPPRPCCVRITEAGHQALIDAGDTGDGGIRSGGDPGRPA